MSQPENRNASASGPQRGSLSWAMFLLIGGWVGVVLVLAGCAGGTVEDGTSSGTLVVIPLLPTDSPSPTSELEPVATANPAAGDEPEDMAPEEPLSIADVAAQALNNLDPGIVVYNPPVAMSAGQAERVELRITREIPNVEALNEPAFAEPAAAITETLSGAGTPRFEDIKVNTYMRVQLIGRDFDIEALTPQDQLVGERDFSEWVWNVTPLKSGELKLNLSITARVRVDDYEEFKNLVVRDETIYVAVNPAYTLATFWERYGAILLVAALIVSVGVLFAARLHPGGLRPNLAGQLATARENLALIEERKSQYVLEEDIPLQLIANERKLKKRISDLKGRIATREKQS
ncbi:MAG: hypothetical protein HC914_12550 [Chloroflexaceae bacterium]|nr:hypothetical protein [Chloroflexaceae bacterium]